MGFAHEPLLERHDLQVSRECPEQLVRPQQKRRIVRASNLLLACHERFIDEHATFGKAGQDHGKQRPVQIAADHDGVELAAGEWPWRIFEVGLVRHDILKAGKRDERFGIAIDRQHLPALLRQPDRVAAAAAGEIEYVSARPDGGGEAFEPEGRRFVENRHLVRKYARTTIS